VPDGEKTRTKFEAGKTQEAGFQLPKVDWLNQVKNDWDKLLYKSALDWKEKKFPEEVEKILVDASDQRTSQRTSSRAASSSSDPQLVGSTLSLLPDVAKPCRDPYLFFSVHGSVNQSN